MRNPRDTLLVISPLVILAPSPVLADKATIYKYANPFGAIFDTIPEAFEDYIAHMPKEAWCSLASITRTKDVSDQLVNVCFKFRVHSWDSTAHGVHLPGRMDFKLRRTVSRWPVAVQQDTRPGHSKIKGCLPQAREPNFAIKRLKNRIDIHRHRIEQPSNTRL